MLHGGPKLARLKAWRDTGLRLDFSKKGPQNQILRPFCPRTPKFSSLRPCGLEGEVGKVGGAVRPCVSGRTGSAAAESRRSASRQRAQLRQQSTMPTHL